MAQPRSIGAQQPIRARKTLAVSCAQKGELIATIISRCRQCANFRRKLIYLWPQLDAPCLDHQYSLSFLVAYRAHFPFVADRKSMITDGAKTLAAGLAAAALFMGAPSAEAGVTLYKTEVKNLVADTPAASSSSKSDAPAKQAAAKRPPPAAETSEGFDPKPLALPLALVAIAGGAAAINVLDPGFGAFMDEWGSKDSRSYAGYEPGLKDTPFFGGTGSVPTSAGGNKGGKPAAKKAAKKGGLFGKK